MSAAYSCPVLATQTFEVIYHDVLFPALNSLSFIEAAEPFFCSLKTMTINYSNRWALIPSKDGP